MAELSNQIDIRQTDVIKEGWLLKRSKYLQDWRRRWVVLTRNYLCSYRGPQQLTNPTEVLPLTSCTTVKSAEDELQRPHGFRVDSPNRVFWLVAPTAAEKEGWIGAIGRQMVLPAAKQDYCEDDVVF